MLFKILVVGRTGDGKSSFCSKLAHQLGCKNSPFVESSNATSHTHNPVNCKVSLYDITDYPGLMDTGGVTKDEHNIRVIVTDARSKNFVHGVILVINEQAPRFDSGMQDAVKLLVDSFGSSVLAHTGIVYTRAFGTVSLQAAQQFTKEVATIITNRTGFSISHLPCWQIDTHPENLAILGVPQERIESQQKKTESAINDMLQWIRTKPQMTTTNAVFGEYDMRRIAREKEEAAKIAEEKTRYNASVIKEESETQVIDLNRTETPIFTSVQKSKQEWIGGAVPKWGSMGKHTVYWNEQVQTGTKVTVTKCEQKRQKKTYGSGAVTYGNWVTVRTWQE